ncbi:hypothetical protein ACFLZ5_00555 [Thermodesulfobacteriota bacterium]
MFYFLIKSTFQVFMQREMLRVVISRSSQLQARGRGAAMTIFEDLINPYWKTGEESQAG